ncbi:DgyrCDS11497 [Dimorphilus gyrociliatus]|uniref:DgyrCDS11497 n=1 Tax=Dimorphilus gyrociliatus TaxID=2664684 RepID=A0A7I8W3J6_9ANNE|nr:DgyrCDS11497 [Dimorphilus gyrociliatus]
MIKHLDTVLLFFIIFSTDNCFSQQTVRPFPSLRNLAKTKKISTVPSDATCGSGQREAFCLSSVIEESITTCKQGFCSQACPYRSSIVKDYLDLFKASGFDLCVTADTVNKRPNSNSGFSAVFKDDPKCTLIPADTILIQTTASFTFTSWAWLNSDVSGATPGHACIVYSGSLFEKYDHNSRETIIKITISPTTLIFTYKTSTSIKALNFPIQLEKKKWTFIALQVYELSASLFINGGLDLFSATQTIFLDSSIVDKGGTSKIGQNSMGNEQFVGRLQDIYFYHQVLTNREIIELYTGKLPEIPTQTKCRCPPDYPRVKPFFDHLCIKNGFPDDTKDVTIEVHLGDSFEVFYVILQFYSPLPKVITIEKKSTADSLVWTKWQLYSYDCLKVFGVPNNGPLSVPDAVNCLQLGTRGLTTPLSKGSITFGLLASEPVARPGYNDYYGTPSLFSFVKAAAVRIRMQEHYSVTNKRHKYYGISEFIVTGRCDCNGHASTCDMTKKPYVCSCETSSFTEGLKCDRCKAMYNKKPFRRGNQRLAYNCQPCECHSHATSCVYNATVDPFPNDFELGDGGVCVNCQHFTEGQHCDTCKMGYFRPIGRSLSATNVCELCNCFPAGVEQSNLECKKVGGQCSCKQNVGKRQCNECKDGYYNLRSANPLGCEPCSCDKRGVIDANSGTLPKCSPEKGSCKCKANVMEKRCDKCKYGYYNLDASNPSGCSPCNCDPLGSTSQFCDPITGNCKCKDRFGGRTCSDCSTGYYDKLNGCKACSCSTLGSKSSICDTSTGQCNCKTFVEGRACDACKTGYFNLGSDPHFGCAGCECVPEGTRGSASVCDKVTGGCACKLFVQGRTCNKCTPNAYGLSGSKFLGCTLCNCDTTGTVNGDILTSDDIPCDDTSGQCACLSKRLGRKCDSCESGYYRGKKNGEGCLLCNCLTITTEVGTTCNEQTGQCACLAGKGLGGRTCNACIPKFYGFKLDSSEPCKPCNCHSAGSISEVCDSQSGQCECKLLTQGRDCSDCKPGSSRLDATNPAGCSKAPYQQPPPDAEALSPTSLKLTWTPPDEPNGVISRYVVYRNEKMIANTSATEYVDTDLQPYTIYSYVVEAINVAGSTRSTTVLHRTPAAVPSNDIILSIFDVTSSRATFSWTEPSSTNGPISLYRLMAKLDDKEIILWSGNSLKATVKTLQAYSRYYVTVSACTLTGCNKTEPVELITREAEPLSQPLPNVVPKSATSFLIEWKPPKFPNGIIIGFEVFQRCADKSRSECKQHRIFSTKGQYDPLAPPGGQSSLPPPAMNYTVTDLTSFYTYEYQILSENAIGKTASEWISATTLQNIPINMSQPIITALNETALNITWSEPKLSIVRGIVVNYKLYFKSENDPERNPFAPPFLWILVFQGSSSDFTFVTGGLQPYEKYYYIVEVCNSVGCANSSSTEGLTAAAAPEQLERPIVNGLNSTAIKLEWKLPLKPNGPNPRYVLRRFIPSFNQPPQRVVKGTRFPGTGYYEFPPDVVPQGVGFLGFDLWFRTNSPFGLIIGALSGGNQEEMFAVQLVRKRPWFIFDPQDCLSTVTPTNDEGLPYYDGKWHHLYAVREGKRGYLRIDGRWIGERTANCGPGSGSVIGNNTGVYVGGLPDDFVMRRKLNLKDDRENLQQAHFSGCIRDVKILFRKTPTEDWRLLDWNNAIRHQKAALNWEGCPEYLPDNEQSRSFHFLGTGYVSFKKELFPNATDWIVELNIVSRKKNGLVFFIHSKASYVLLELFDGFLNYKFKNDKIYQNITMKEKYLCDGGSYLLRLSLLNGNLQVRITGVASVRKFVPVINPPTFFNSPIYFGGIKENSAAEKFLKENEMDYVLENHFYGCMQQLTINYKRISADSAFDSLNVNLDTCPPINSKKRDNSTCNISTTEVIYNGTNTSAIDFNLQPFSEYLYQVEAINNEGSTKTEWTRGRTKEWYPENVEKPAILKAINGFTILAEWTRPESFTGRILYYLIKAYIVKPLSPTFAVDKLNSPFEARLEIISGEEILWVNVTDVIPDYRYNVTVTACTVVGCIESDEGVEIDTPEEAPSNVSPPELVSVQSDSISIKWLQPKRPNGHLTGYILYNNGKRVYSGNERSFTLTGLQVYATYIIRIEACTKVGCTSSAEFKVGTAQLPPSQPDKPILTILGTNRLRVEWKTPTQLNGVLNRYLVYLSTQPNLNGSLAYNSTNLFTFTTLTNLEGGILYYVRVGACTFGGCSISQSSSAKTEESAPDGIVNPNVTSPSSSELNVTWSPPSLTNGVITEYRLYHNEIRVFNSSSSLFYLISGLQPYTLHSLRLVVCTIKGCASSDVVEIRTQEAPPIGTVGLELTVADSRSVNIRWTRVPVPNGKITYTTFFDGLYYRDIANWNYSTERERRSLYTSQEFNKLTKIEGLVPYSIYIVQVNASNSKGFVISNTQTAQMPMSYPDGVKEPTLISSNSRTVNVIWTKVGRSNSDDEPLFQLEFKAKLPNFPPIKLFPEPSTSTSFIKDNLEPFSQYEFRIIASNNYGIRASEWASITTKQDKPTGVDPPMIRNIKARSAFITWSPPLNSNGIISEYVIYANNKSIASFNGNTTSSQLIDAFLPNSNYIIKVKACTVAGCTVSGPSTEFKTLESPPEGVDAPKLTSPTPTSILISWEEPKQLNGVLKAYVLERRLQKDPGTITVVKTFSQQDNKQYIDSSKSIMPFTTYEYRIKVSNEAGETESTWSSIRTKPSRPSDVRPPNVFVLSPTSVNVSWISPLVLNGQLELFIIKFPLPRIEIANVSISTIIVKDLIPFTTYSITIIACTDGGCTESQPTVIRTFPSGPKLQTPPKGNPISQTYISVIWSKPLQPNGPSLEYELARMKIRQPLNPSSEGINGWSTIYRGNSTYYEDRGLTLFTTYQYRVTSYNNYGHVISLPSDEVTTFGGTPKKPATVKAVAISYISIQVSWIIPELVDLQGEIISFEVEITSSTFAKTEKLDSSQSFVLIENLEPSRDYSVIVTYTINGGASISSPAVQVTTPEGKPEGLSPPIITTASDTSLRLSWTAPTTSNGAISGYYIYKNEEKIDPSIKVPSTYLLTNLTPFIVYTIVLEACTRFACTKAEPVRRATIESLPMGIDPPTATVFNSSTILIKWKSPSSPNGVISGYKLFKKSYIPCSEKPTTNKPPIKPCSYVKCSLQENICGRLCYTGQKTCCSGVLYDNKKDYVCCGVKYVRRLATANSICCGDTLYEKRTGFSCCGNRYVRLSSDDICCIDPKEDRVEVGLGDTCCSSIPFSSNSSQICCEGTFLEAHSKSCCGGQAIDKSQGLTCCGNGITGKWYEKDISKSCCSSEYTTTALMVCCPNAYGSAKLYTYKTVEDKASANEKCCGDNLIAADKSCCGSTPFDASIQVCAEKPTIGSGQRDCGKNSICSLAQAPNAYCDECNFDRSNYKCVTYNEDYSESPEPDDTADTKLCLSDPVLLYEGDELEYTDSNLFPFTKYQYAIRAENSIGGTESDYRIATTKSSLPEGVDPPVAKVNKENVDIILLTWRKPSNPNGQITYYLIKRNNVEMFKTTSKQEFTDNNGIEPYKTYVYTLTVCNIAGCRTSSPIQVATLQSRPESVFPPKVANLTSRSIQLQWQMPAKSNGILMKFVVYELTTVTSTVMSPNAKLLILDDLTPYTTMKFSLEACTEVGCTNSTFLDVTTLEDRPDDILPPRPFALSSSSVKIDWSPPEKPNGIITQYTLLRSVSADSILVAIYEGLNLQVIDKISSKGQTVNYVIEVSTVVGATRSNPASINLPTDSPVIVSPPENVEVLSSTSIKVTWKPVTGNIDQYRIVLNPGLETQLVKGVGKVTETIINGLLPYTFYDVRLQACLSGLDLGCGTSLGKTVRTSEAIPDGVPIPKLLAVSDNVIDISWTPPLKPNGVIRAYEIRRRDDGDTGNGIPVGIVNDKTTFRNKGGRINPFTIYNYAIVAINSVGRAIGEWGSVRSLEAPPTGLSDPIISSIGSRRVGLKWTAPKNPNGIIIKYTISYRWSTNEPTNPERTQSVAVPGDLLSTSVSGLFPFTNYKFKLIAENKEGSEETNTIDAKTAQSSPSGVNPISVELLSSGKAVILRWDAPKQKNGVITEYAIYENGARIYQGLSTVFELTRLKPFTEYQLILEACTSIGCTRTKPNKFKTAEIEPSSQLPPILNSSANANNVTIKWTPPIEPNGNIIRYDVLRRDLGARRSKRSTSERIVFSTTDTQQQNFEFTDSNLKAYNKYEYAIRAINSKGSTISPWTVVETPQGIPEFVEKPRLSYVKDHWDRLLIEWSEPAKSNGILKSYLLTRNDTVPLSFDAGDKLRYVDLGLSAFTFYSYTITACTGGGCSISKPALIQTKETEPLSVGKPSIDVIDSTSLNISWTEPSTSNGHISKYKLTMDDSVIYEGLDYFFVAKSLIPAKSYRFKIIACTSGGCTESGEITGQPDEAPPEDLKAPKLKVTSSKSILVTWKMPTKPNGLIIGYDVKRNGQTVGSSTPSFRYEDSDLQPATAYTYIIEAWNNKGSVRSPPATAKTYDDSPEGLSKPIVKGVSSSSVYALWQEPVKPNGIIANYTLYYTPHKPEGTVSDKLEFLGGKKQYNTTIDGLRVWTEYRFSVEACTNSGCVVSEDAIIRTLSARPEELSPPNLTPSFDKHGAHSGVSIRWTPPKRPNGVISKYQLERKFANNGTVIIYEGPLLRFEDTDPLLKANSEYEYRIRVFNEDYSKTSAWSKVKTNEGFPEQVPSPKIEATSSTTITVQILDAQLSNGKITLYIIYVFEEKAYEGNSKTAIVGQGTLKLKPFTTYEIRSAVCTIVGCTKSEKVLVATKAEKPTGISKIFTDSIQSNSIKLKWNEPSSPNGNLSGYILKMAKTCPYPYADKLPGLTCTNGSISVAYRGPDTSFQAVDLEPFTNYAFELNAVNLEKGVSLESSKATFTSGQKAPKYDELPKTIWKENEVVVDWSSSFLIYASVIRFVLYKDDKIEYSGLELSKAIATPSKDDTYRLWVTLETVMGTARSKTLICLSNKAICNTVTEELSAVSKKEVYEEVWFIILLLLILLILIVVVVICCLRASAKKSNGSRAKRRTNHFISDPFDYGATRSDVGVASITQTLPDTRVGYTNPALSRPSSVPDLTADKLSQQSKWDDVDSFDGHAYIDSGLHSLAYGEEDDSSDAPVSILKERTVFTDTHL